MDKQFNFTPYLSELPSEYNPFSEAEALRTCVHMSEWRAVAVLEVGQQFDSSEGTWERIA